MAGLIASVEAAEATTFTLNFKGVVTSAEDSSFNNLPGEVGKSVSGQLRYSGNSTTTPFVGSEETLFDHAEYSFKVDSEPTLTGSSDAHNGITLFSFTNSREALIDIGPGPAAIELAMFWDPSTALFSLANFPQNSAASSIYFGAPFGGHGVQGGIDTPNIYTFNLTSYSVASTPLPASALMFITALGGVGMAAWRRHKMQAISAA